MEAIQPFLLALLALNVVIFAPLLLRTIRRRVGRQRDQDAIDAATPRMLARLAAIASGAAAVDAAGVPATDLPPAVAAASLADSSEAAHDPGLPVAQPASPTPRPAPDLPPPSGSRRRVWRDASAALIAFAAMGLVVLIALPDQGPPPPAATDVAVVVTPDATGTPAATEPAVALAASPLPTRMAVALPTERPTPTLPVTVTPRPVQRVAAPRATSRPTPKPTPRPTPKPPKATPKPTPRPTPVPPPIARFTWTIPGGAGSTTVAFDNNSKTYGVAADWLWEFGDGDTSGAKNPAAHAFPGSGCYVVSLTVSTSGGSDTLSKPIGVDAPCS
ncbi:MAG: PKD domain-containing protein [Candidatus Limnocylindrales bacterium]